MTIHSIHSVHIMWQKGIEEEMLGGVFSGVADVLFLAGVYNEFRIEHLEQRRQSDWLNADGSLKPYQSLDWHINMARQNSKIDGTLNSEILLNSLRENPSHETEPRYEVVVVKEPIHCGNNRNFFGIARQNQGAVVTLHHHLSLLNAKPIVGETNEDRNKRRFYYWLFTKLNTMHELGHVRGLFVKDSTENATPEERWRAHCLNECVMYWEQNFALYNEIQNRPFCQSCLEELLKLSLVF